MGVLGTSPGYSHTHHGGTIHWICARGTSVDGAQGCGAWLTLLLGCDIPDPRSQ